MGFHLIRGKKIKFYSSSHFCVLLLVSVILLSAFPISAQPDSSGEGVDLNPPVEVSEGITIGFWIDFQKSNYDGAFLKLFARDWLFNFTKKNKDDSLNLRIKYKGDEDLGGINIPQFFSLSGINHVQIALSKETRSVWINGVQLPSHLFHDDIVKRSRFTSKLNGEVESGFSMNKISGTGTKIG